MALDPYAVLEIAPDAPPDEIRRAYKRLAMQWHPDRNRDPAATERFRDVAAAWAILGDPQRRFAHDGRAAGPGGADADFVDQVANAIERAQDYIERVVLPHYGSRFRGVGAEMASQWARDLGSLADPRWLTPRVSWSGRRRAARWRDQVGVAFGAQRWDVTHLQRHRFGWTIQVSPAALWNGGIRDPIRVDDAVLRLLLARYAQAVGAGRAVVPHQDQGEAWDRAIAQARSVDDEVVRASRWRTALWVGVAALIAFMFYAGFTQL